MNTNPGLWTPPSPSWCLEAEAAPLHPPHPHPSRDLPREPRLSRGPRTGRRLRQLLFSPRSTSDVGSKTRMAESAGPEPAQLHDSASFAQVSRGPVSVAQLDQSALNYSGGPERKSLEKARALPPPPGCVLYPPRPLKTTLPTFFLPPSGIKATVLSGSDDLLTLVILARRPTAFIS